MPSSVGRRNRQTAGGANDTGHEADALGEALRHELEDRTFPMPSAPMPTKSTATATRSGGAADTTHRQAANVTSSSTSSL
jgi:hypothetical protein